MRKLLSAILISCLSFSVLAEDKTYSRNELPQLNQEILENSNSLRDAFGKEVIQSYIKLKKQEIKNFNNRENFNKKRPVTQWEKDNTLDC